MRFWVQDGCDYKCTYCTIPGTWNFRSDTLENIISQAKEIVRQDIKKLYWRGLILATMGKVSCNKKHEHTFLELVQALARLRASIVFESLRLSPTYFQELINLLLHPNDLSLIFIYRFGGNNEILGQISSLPTRIVC